MTHSRRGTLRALQWEQTEPVRQHPDVLAVCADDPEPLAERCVGLAHELSAWLLGVPEGALSPLARVLCLLATEDVWLTRARSRERPLLAMAAGAAWTVVAWPFLRDPPPPPTSEAAASTGDGEEAGAPQDDAVGEAEAVLTELAGDDAMEDDLLAAWADGLADEAELTEAMGQAQEGAGEATWTAAELAEEALQTLEQLIPGVGWSVAPGALEQAAARRVADLAELLSHRETLAALAAALGRVEHDARAARSDTGGGEEVVGVGLSGDVARALPSEVGLLGDADTEDLFFVRWMERRLVSLEMAGAGLDGVDPPKARGPVICCVDTSGSMQGLPEVVAKALVLAVGRQVLPRGRAVHLLLFSGTEEQTELRLTRRHVNAEAMLDFLLSSFGGGTDFDKPLERALELLEERALEAADILVVTDGYGHVNLGVQRQLEAARSARGLRVFTALVGPQPPGEMALWSDEVWRIGPAEDGTPGAIGLHKL